MKIYPPAPAVIVEMRNKCPSCERGFTGQHGNGYQPCSCNKPPLTEGRVRGTIKGSILNRPKPHGPTNLDINDFTEYSTPTPPPPTTDYVNTGKKQDNIWSWYVFGIGFCVGTLVWSFMLILSKIGG